MNKYTIIAITEWEEDTYEEMADSGHISDGDIMRKKLGEFVDKIDNDNWPGLPFTCEADNEDDAVAEYNRQCCDGDYYKAAEAEFEEVD